MHIIIVKKINFTQLDINNFMLKFLPFVHLVNYWSQILGFVIYKCSNPNIRGKIIKNLYEENCEEYTHVDTFLLFMKEININNNNLDFDIKFIPKNLYIEQAEKRILEFVLNNTFDDSCQMLGAIEYIYHLISEDINTYICKNYNIKPQYHYTIHEILDIKHATDLFDCSTQKINIKNLKFGYDWIVNSIQSLLNS